MRWLFALSLVSACSPKPAPDANWIERLNNTSSIGLKWAASDEYTALSWREERELRALFSQSKRGSTHRTQAPWRIDAELLVSPDERVDLCARCGVAVASEGEYGFEAADALALFKRVLGPDPDAPSWGDEFL